MTTTYEYSRGLTDDRFFIENKERKELKMSLKKEL
jgi:hypothetical protein